MSSLTVVTTAETTVIQPPSRGTCIPDLFHYADYNELGSGLMYTA